MITGKAYGSPMGRFSNRTFYPRQHPCTRKVKGLGSRVIEKILRLARHLRNTSPLPSLSRSHPADTHDVHFRASVYMHSLCNCRYIYVHICIYIHVYMYIYVYTTRFRLCNRNTSTLTHTHTHTHTHTWGHLCAIETWSGSYEEPRSE